MKLPEEYKHLTYERYQAMVDAKHKELKEQIQPRKRVPDGAMAKSKRPEMPDPKGLASAFEGRFPLSTEEDWNYWANVGWLHESEIEKLRCHFCQCSVRKTWHRAAVQGSMVKTNDGELICIEEAKENWAEDIYTHRYHHPSNLIEVRDKGGKSMLVGIGTRENHFTKDDFDQFYYPRHQVITIRKLPSQTDADLDNISRISLFNLGRLKRHIVCNNCGFGYRCGPEEFMVNNTGHHQSDYPSICPKCYQDFASRNAILAHDSHDYPKIIRSAKLHGSGLRVGDTKIGGLVCSSGKMVEDEYTMASKRLFGCEAEIEISGDYKKDRVPIAVELRQKVLGSDFIICKHDGSIGGTRADGTGGDKGFEIVTAPADLETHRKKWPLLEAYDKYKRLRSWDTHTCGFHIHVSRESITTFALSRMLVFVNHPNNKQFIQKVAGRSETKYTKYYEKKAGDALLKAKGRGTDGERRQAINQMNPHTIEFRIFRGTINPRHILRNIEFVDAVCCFCHPGSRSFKELMDFKCFIDYVDHNRKRWSLLGEWMAFHKIIELGPVNRMKANLGKITLDPTRAPEAEMPPELIKLSRVLEGGVLVGAQPLTLNQQQAEQIVWTHTSDQIQQMQNTSLNNLQQTHPATHQPNTFIVPEEDEEEPAPPAF